MLHRCILPPTAIVASVTNEPPPPTTSSTAGAAGAPPASPPLPRPDHLAPGGARPDAARWLLDHAAGLSALLLGALAFIVVTVRQRELWSQPDFRLTVPFFVATLVATAIAFARKEKSYALPLLGLGLAAATLVLGWFFLVAAVIVATGLVILAISHVL